MSRKHSHTTADYLEWDIAMNLVRRLYADGNYRMSLLVACGCFLGLRISDLRGLTWAQILSSDELVIYEKKTGKRRVIRINKGFQKHAQDCYNALQIKDASEPCILNRFGSIMSIQMINRHFKTIKVKYQLKINNFSSHTLRKTFGRRVVDMAGPNAEMALIKLSEIFNHAGGTAITRRYLGLRQQELAAIYDSLQF